MDISAVLKSDVFWSAVGAIATVGGAMAVFFAIRQLRFEAWLKAQEIWTTREFTEARGRVFARLDSGNAQWTAQEEEEALDVSRKMDEFAGLIPYLPKRTALRIWGVPFAKAWLILEPVINRERAKCGWPDKWHAFERLGCSALTSHPEARKRSYLPSEKAAANNRFERDASQHRRPSNAPLCPLIDEGQKIGVSNLHYSKLFRWIFNLFQKIF